MPNSRVTPLEGVKARISLACARVGRDPAEVRLVAVTKGQSAARIEREVLEAGHRLLGESRIQEWRQKAEGLAGVDWHFIGNLQTNKVKYCRGFSLIHSLNSARLADALESFGRKRGHTFGVLLEVNVAGEEAKQGVSLKDAHALAAYVSSLSFVRLQGLMTIAPYVGDPEASRHLFRKLRELRDTLGLSELSMGMTGDFEVAVEEGASYVRVGSALFPETRPRVVEAAEDREDGVKESHET
ncbi:MAG: YggS family pyridoxal phosphate-dependent enzyme [Deinococcota bacterium]|nr:YggS family pyridoxal phosphate-dependent enzyme [Deinococcota bacterium]